MNEQAEDRAYNVSVIFTVFQFMQYMLSVAI